MKTKTTTTWKVRASGLLAILLVLTLTLSACDWNAEPNPAPTPNPPQQTQPIPASKPGVVTVHVWDVGEALSILIDDDDMEILIDAGNDRDGSVLAEKIRPYVGDGTIEYVIATHSHADHIGGMEYIYEAYHVAHTIYGDTGTSQQFGQFMNAAMAEEDSTVRKDEDEVIEMPNGAKLKILDIMNNAPNTNNNSVITLLETNGYKMLVTGDAEDEANKGLQSALTERLQTENLYPVNVYVVGHHGSETSSSSALLSLIRPTYALVSSKGTSGNYHNPDESVITRLIGVNANIFATYRSGDIEVTFGKNSITLSAPDGERLTLENYREAA